MKIGEEGTVSFWLKHEHPDWATNSHGYNFAGPPIPELKIGAVKHPDQSVEIRLDGPENLHYHRRVPMPACPKNMLNIILTWKGNKRNLFLNAKPMPEPGVEQRDQQVVKVVLSPHHGPGIASGAGVLFSITSPYSKTTVTLLVAPNVTNYQEGGGNVRHKMEQESTPQSSVLSLDLEGQPEGKAFVDGKNVTIRLLDVGKENYQGQDFPTFEFLVTSE